MAVLIVVLSVVAIVQQLRINALVEERLDALEDAWSRRHEP